MPSTKDERKNAADVQKRHAVMPTLANDISSSLFLTTLSFNISSTAFQAATPTGYLQGLCGQEGLVLALFFLRLDRTLSSM
jgi:hypothetical protein